MKLMLIFLSSIISCASFSQILNGSFENNSGADLLSWEWICGADSFNSAPTGGGNWSIQVEGGNMQGCFPGYAYQKIPSITNGQTYILSGWAFAQTSPAVGIYFGKINNGIITLQAGSTTASASWTELSVQSGFTLSAGDTAAVVLYGGLVTGAAQGYGYFDLINLQQVTGISPVEQNQSIKLFPNPFFSEATLQTDKPFKDATLTVYNSCGQTVKQMTPIAIGAGQTITLHRDNLPGGLYFLNLAQDNKIIATEKLIINDK